MFDTNTWNHGCAYSQVKQTSDFNFSGNHKINDNTFLTQDYGNLAIAVTANARNMNDQDIDGIIFTYPLNENYLTVPEVNPCMNSFQGAASNGLAWLDGTTYSYSLDFPATRVFAVDGGASCDEPDESAIIVFNNDGDVIDCNTAPFSFCNGVLSFKSLDNQWEGVHEFSALGFTYTVLQPGDEPYEENAGGGIGEALEAEFINRKLSMTTSPISTTFGQEPPTGDYQRQGLASGGYTLSDLPANMQQVPGNMFPWTIGSDLPRANEIIIGYRQLYPLDLILDDSPGQHTYTLYNEDKSKFCNVLEQQELCGQLFPWGRMPDSFNSQGFFSIEIFAKSEEDIGKYSAKVEF